MPLEGIVGLTQGAQESNLLQNAHRRMAIGAIIYFCPVGRIRFRGLASGRQLPNERDRSQSSSCNIVGNLCLFRFQDSFIIGAKFASEVFMDGAFRFCYRHRVILFSLDAPKCQAKERRVIYKELG